MQKNMICNDVWYAVALLRAAHVLQVPTTLFAVSLHVSAATAVFYLTSV